MIDTLHHVEAPEGVDLALRLAGPTPRALAYLADVAVRFFVYGVAAIPLSSLLAQVGFGIWFMIVALGEVVYPVLFEVFGDGQTLGKRMLGLRVVHADGTRIQWRASLLRNLLLSADWLPGTYLFAAVSMLVSRRFQRIGDHAAGTLVVYVNAPSRRAPPAALVEPAAPPIPLSLAERAALLAFGGRSGAFAPARREELASLATPLLRSGEPAAPQLEAIAAHLRGAERPR
jgi:uncharacterized RDD family membrane protein YckC